MLTILFVAVRQSESKDDHRSDRSQILGYSLTSGNGLPTYATQKTQMPTKADILDTHNVSIDFSV